MLVKFVVGLTLTVSRSELENRSGINIMNIHSHAVQDVEM